LISLSRLLRVILKTEPLAVLFGIISKTATELLSSDVSTATDADEALQKTANILGTIGLAVTFLVGGEVAIVIGVLSNGVALVGVEQSLKDCLNPKDTTNSCGEWEDVCYSAVGVDGKPLSIRCIALPNVLFLKSRLIARTPFAHRVPTWSLRRDGSNI
jgi:hypothetical protein